MNKIMAEDNGNGLKIEVQGELGFAISVSREILEGIATVAHSRVNGFTAALSTIIEEAFEDPKDRDRIATLLYREYGGNEKCTKY